jgi:hypothetical protein
MSDPTLEDRVVRYERIMAMRSEVPPLSYAKIGATFDPPLSKERVRQIVKAGKPRRAGRPASPDRRTVLRRKLAFHERRLRAAIADGRSPGASETRIAELSVELARLP